MLLVRVEDLVLHGGCDPRVMQLERQAFAANLEDLDAHLVAQKDRRFSAAIEIFQRDLLSGLADQARTKVSTE